MMSDGLQRLDQERSEAASKRERKVAAGHKGAVARWKIDGRTNALADGTNMATASDTMADASFCQWPSASASASDSSALDEKEEGLALAREREPNVMLMSMAEATEHLRKTGALAASDDEASPSNPYARAKAGM